MIAISRISELLNTAYSSFWQAITADRRTLTSLGKRIEQLEKGVLRMSKAIDDLNAQVQQLDTDEKALEDKETKDAADISTLQAQVKELQDELAAAQSSGDEEAVAAATEKIATIDQRIRTLLGTGTETMASTGTGATSITTGETESPAAAVDSDQFRG